MNEIISKNTYKRRTYNKESSYQSVLNSSKLIIFDSELFYLGKLEENFIANHVIYAYI